MPRPKSKSELLEASANLYGELKELVDSLSRSERAKTFPFEHRDRNIRDVIAHLHEWHLMMLGWYEKGMHGNKPDMPAPGYSWKMTPELNLAIWEKYQSTTLVRMRNKLAQTHARLMDLIESHSDKELFTKRLYSWTGSTSLGSYLTSSLSSHYSWAIKIVRRFAKSLKE